MRYNAYVTDWRVNNTSMKIYISPSSQTTNMYSGQNISEGVVCRKIGEHLETALKRNGVTVKLANENLTYRERVEESNTWVADYHVAIHTNAGGGKGTRLFCTESTSNLDITKAVFESVSSLTPTDPDRIVENYALYEIKKTTMPCLYLEVEFHDNENLAKWILDNEENIAEAICKGLVGNSYIGEQPMKENTTNDVWYRVKVGAFKNKDNAERLVEQLSALGFPCYITTD